MLKFDELMGEVREGHLRAYLKGEKLLMPMEVRAVVRASIEARDELLRKCLPHLGMSLSAASGQDFRQMTETLVVATAL
jgi:hypothetical protein